MGTQAFMLAMIFWLKHTTESPMLIGLLQMLALIPQVVLGPFAGAFSDIVSRKNIIVIGDFLSGIFVTALAIMMFSVSDKLFLITFLFITTILVEVVAAFFNPAISAFIPDVVPQKHLERANAYIESSRQIGMISANGAGGFIFSLLGAPVLFLIDGLTYLFSGFTELFISSPQQEIAKKQNMKELIKRLATDTKEGFYFIRHTEGFLEFLLVAALLNFFYAPLSVILPFHVEDTLARNVVWFGIMTAAMGAGTLLGMFFIGSKLDTQTLKRSTKFICALAFSAGCLGTLGLIHNLFVNLALLFFIGAVNGYINIHIYTLLQRNTPVHLRGRAFGILVSIAMIAFPAGLGISGFALDLLNKNTSVMFIFCGICLIGICLFLATRTRIKIFFDAPKSEL